MTNPTQHLGKYDILEELGRGGFGAVYRALDTTLKREVALKILNPALLHEEGWLARFRREAQVIASLDHPRIVAVYEIAEADYRVFIAMKLLRGPSLDKVLAERGALPWADAQRISREVAEALAYAHAQGVLHRDIKPANVVLDATTGAALTDFGFARLVGESSYSLSMSGGLVGTPHYIAPELWHNQPASPASDLYALGCILYEMVVGRKAFPGDTSPAVMMAHFQPLALPDTWPEGTPPGLDAVLRRTLAQQPGDRYPTLAAFVEALAALHVDPWAVPYTALEDTVAAGEWQKALKLAEDIHAQAPTYRAVAQLLEKARAEITRADLIAQWRAQTETALQAGQPQAARAAAEQWLRLAPEDKEAQAALAQVEAFTAHSEGFSYLETPKLQPLTAISPENANRVTQLSRWGKGPIVHVASFSENDILAVAFHLGISLYSASSLAELRWTETDAGMYYVAFAPDGDMLASVVNDETVRLWRIHDGKLLHELKGHENFVRSVAFAPDGQMLACGDEDGTIYLWQVGTGRLIRTLEGHTDTVWNVAFAPNGNRLASTSSDNTVRLWRVSDGTLLRTLEGHTDTVSSVAFAPDGATLASGSGDAAIRLWRVSDGVLLHILVGHTDAVWSVAFAPDGNTLASGSSDETLRLWRLSNGELMRTLEGHTAPVSSVAFAPSGNTLISRSEDCTVGLWNVRDGTLLRSLEGYMYRVDGVAFAPNGATFASWADDKKIRLWRVSDGKLLCTLKGHADRVRNVAFSLDGSLLASGSDDYMVHLWQVSDGRLLRILKGHTSLVGTVAFSPSGEIIASGSADKTVQLWRASDGRLLHTLRHTEPVTSVAFAPDGHKLASTTWDCTVYLWQVHDGTLLNTLEGHTNTVESIAFAPDGNSLASGGWDKTIRLWRVRDGKLLRTLEGHTNLVLSVAFSPDGNVLVSGSKDDTVRLWQVSNGRLLRILEEHADTVTNVGFAPDGNKLASGAIDNTVRFWGIPPK